LNDRQVKITKKYVIGKFSLRWL